MLIVLTAVAGCGGGEGQPQAGVEPVNLTIAAAASLQDAAGELKTIYEQQQAGVKITYNFASSGTLQKQIEGVLRPICLCPQESPRWMPWPKRD